VAPEDRGLFLTERGPEAFKKVRFGKEGKESLYISTKGELARTQIDDTYFKIDSEEGIKQFMQNMRSKVASGGQAASEAMGLWRTLSAKDPFNKTADDYIMELSARDVIVETLPGLGQKFEGRQASREKSIRVYGGEKAKFMDAWRAASNMSLTRDQKKQAAQDIKKFNDKYASQDFHTPLNEKELLNLLR